MVYSSCEYAACLASADAVFPDGAGGRLGARLQGRRFLGNLNGTDLVPALCARLGAIGGSVYLLGGAPGVAADAAAALLAAVPGLRIAGVRDGFFPDEDEVVAAVNRTRADLPLVARGVPLQDVFLTRIGGRIEAPLQMGVGALFDFLAARVPRAPAWLRSLGLEWSYRLLQEPQRMWRRYVLGNPSYVAHAIIEAAPSIIRVVDAAAKRMLDVVLASAALALASPVLLLVGLLVRSTSPGPALFRQVRVGLDGREFTMLKFRSMVVDAEALLPRMRKSNVHGPELDFGHFWSGVDPEVRL